MPWAGDVLTALLGLAILVAAHRRRVPGVVQVRMLLNLAIDLAIGLVPFAGDVADFFWKANTRNMTLLERHAASPMPATAGDWWFVGRHHGGRLFDGGAAAVAVVLAAERRAGAAIQAVVIR